jgi:drug/metabolite transporter (DMT)-like permease
MTAALLALGTALSYGIANFVAPILARRMPLAAVLGASQLGGLAASLAAACATGDLAMSPAGLSFALTAGITNALALACFYQAGRTGELSVVTPIAATGAVVPLLVGLMLADQPTIAQLIAILVTLVGIVFAARRPSTRECPVPPSQPAGSAPSGQHGIGWAVPAALLFGMFLTTYAWAADESVAGALLWSRVALISTTGAGILILRAPLRVHPRHATLAFVPGVLLAMGTFAFGEATRIGLLSVVSVIATLNPVVTCILAFVLLGERPAPMQRLGAGLAIAGTVLLATG